MMKQGSQKKKAKVGRLSRLSQNRFAGQVNAFIDTLNMPRVVLVVLLVLALLIGYKSMVMDKKLLREQAQKSYLQISHSAVPREYSELAQKVYLTIKGGEKLEIVKQSTQDTYGYAQYLQVWPEVLKLLSAPPPLLSPPPPY